MAIGELLSKGREVSTVVLTKYEADISQQKRAIKDLEGEQKKQAQKHIDALERENEAIRKQNWAMGETAKQVIAVGALIELTPRLYELAKQAAQGLLDVTERWRDASVKAVDAIRSARDEHRLLFNQYARQQELLKKYSGREVVLGQVLGDEEQQLKELRAKWAVEKYREGLLKARLAREKAAREKAARKREAERALELARLQKYAIDYSSIHRSALEWDDMRQRFADPIGLQSVGAAASPIGPGGPLGDMTDALGRIIPPEFVKAEGKPSLIEQAFGKPEEIDMVTESLRALGAGMALAGEAFRTGADMGEVFKKALAGIGDYFSKELLVLAKSEAIKALVSFAAGNVGAGGLHLAASVAAAGGARFVAGITGATATATVSTGTGGFSSPSQAGATTTTTTTIYLGDDYIGMSNRRRRSELTRILGSGRTGSYEG